MHMHTYAASSGGGQLHYDFQIAPAAVSAAIAAWAAEDADIAASAAAWATATASIMATPDVVYARCTWNFM